MSTNCDLIKTIDDDQEVQNFSENSDEEDDYQPRQQKKQERKDFDNAFHFMADAAEYNQDTWDDVKKYMKRKASTKLDDKIKKKRRLNAEENGDDKEIKDEEDDNENNEEDGIILSDDDLREDTLRTREKKIKKKSVKESEKMIFEEVIDENDTHATFHQMNLSRPLLKAITAMNLTTPTPIQAATIPVALMGRDAICCAATGTGKTLAYLLPTFERLLYRPSNGPAVTRVLILVPTRELGVQIYQVACQLKRFTPTIEIALSVGGLDLKVQESMLRKNPDIVIATPGRLIDHLENTPTFSLDSIEVLILDEADRMLDEYFAEQMKHIIKQCSRSRQTLLFSATMTEQVKDLAAVSLDRPVKIFVDSNQRVVFNLRQEFIRIRQGREGDREAILTALVYRIFKDHTIIFVETKKQAHRLHILLGLLGVKICELHGNLSQAQRIENLENFKNGKVDILIATNVAARGLDINDVKTVINFVMPATIEQYIHRVGRTARAGKAGVSISIVGENERRLVKEIHKQAENQIKKRIINPDIVDKYNKKLESLEADVNAILEEQRAEAEIAKMENRANKAQNILNNVEDGDDQRGWFQTKRQRKVEKDSLKLTEKAQRKSKKNDKSAPSNLVEENKKNKIKKKKKEPEMDPAEARAQKELEKVSAYQARLAKKSNKLKKIRTVVDNDGGGFSKNKGPMKKPKSSFSSDLTDTSTKGVKRLRYDANTKQKQKFGRPGGKPGGRPGGRPSGKPGGRPSGKPGGRPSGKPGGRPSGKPGGRPSGKSGGGRGGPPKSKRR